MADRPEVARRGPGRPRRPADTPRAQPRHVLLDVEADDAICRLSNRSGVSIHKLLQLAVHRLLADERGGVLVVGVDVPD